MSHRPSTRLTWMLLACALLAVAAAWTTPDVPLGAGGAALLVVTFVWRVRRRAPQAVAADPAAASAGATPPARQRVDAPRSGSASRVRRPSSVPRTEQQALIDQMLQQGRYTLLLRRQLVGNLDREQLEHTLELLHEAMAVVPEGNVRMAQPDWDAVPGHQEPAPGRLVHVAPLLLDRYAVTNADYQKFVDAGGYQEMPLWAPEIWPGVLQFVDRTRHPGPRDWTQGAHHPDLADHPVVGVSWYEAAAYARWVGKRLPTDAEWVKAASWPVAVGGVELEQRRYPWGESLDERKANVWSTGAGRTVPVTALPAGSSVNGIVQLIGNVWEWTTGDYGMWHPPSRSIQAPQPLKSLRGGAFDTYLEHQATCDFQSGDSPLARKHNIGFRCAISLCDLALWTAEEACGEQLVALDDARQLEREESLA